MPSRVTAATVMVPVCQMLRAMARAFTVQLPQLMWLWRRRWLCSVPFDHAAEEADELVLCVELVIERLAPLHCVSHANSGTTTSGWQQSQLSESWNFVDLFAHQETR